MAFNKPGVGLSPPANTANVPVPASQPGFLRSKFKSPTSVHDVPSHSSVSPPTLSGGAGEIRPPKINPRVAVPTPPCLILAVLTFVSSDHEVPFHSSFSKLVAAPALSPLAA